MVNVNQLAELAEGFGLSFTGQLRHEKIVEIAQAWLPDVNFHEVERFHSIDLQDLYTVPAEDFADFNAEEQQDFAINVGGIPLSPPIVRVGDQAFGFGETAQDALQEEDVNKDAVYSHGGNLRAAEKFFGSETDVPGPGNPRLPREPLKARAEFRMLLETLKFDLALEDIGEMKPIDAIWGDFDVTDLLLRRIDPDTGDDAGPATGSVRREFARELIQEFEAGNFAIIEERLQSPPLDGFFQTKANPTVWLALSKCGFLEYHFIYAYNDFHRYGGVFTNEHEGDNEGCCLVFEREMLLEWQSSNENALMVSPLGLLTSVHNESNKADERRAIDADPGDARDGLDVYVARGSHATYLTPGTHDFLDISDLERELPDSLIHAIAILVPPPILLSIIAIAVIYEHFNGDPDETSEDGVTGQSAVDPASNPETHLQMELVVTPLSNINSDNDTSIYDLSRPDGRAELALRAFQGRLGVHNGLRDKSPKWRNKTRRYFKQLVRALETGEFRSPVTVIVN